MQRPERIVLIGVSALACGITASFIGEDYKYYIPGTSIRIFETITVFTLPITVMAVLTNITALKRLFDAKKAMEAQK
jgi:CDP-diacylglycerol--glycerol-3-phosphate 3-phosphatidyltransferase